MTLREVSVASAKQAVLDMVHRLPEDASLEDIQYHLFVLQKIERGLADAEGPSRAPGGDGEAVREVARSIFWSRSAPPT